VKKLLVAIGLCLIGAAHAQAQAYPGDKVVRILVPFAAGSSTDMLARQIADGLSHRMKGTFIVEDRPGANGIIATEEAARALPDGHTLLLGNTSTHSQNPWMMKRVPYDPVKDFTPVAGIGGFPMLVVVPAALPVNSLEEFVKYATDRPGALSYGAPNGTSQVCAELLKRKFRIDVIAVRYKSGPQAITDLLAGHLTMICSDYFAAIGLVNSGELKALAVTDDNRSAGLPAVPAIKEVAKGFEELRTWAGVFAPQGTPPEIVEMLAKNVLAITAEPQFLERFASMSFSRTSLSQQDFGKFVQKQLAAWGEWTKQAGIQAQ